MKGVYIHSAYTLHCTCLAYVVASITEVLPMYLIFCSKIVSPTVKTKVFFLKKEDNNFYEKVPEIFTAT